MSTEKPKPQDRRQIQLDLSDLAQIETQLNNSFWQNRKKKETMNHTVRNLVIIPGFSSQGHPDRVDGRVGIGKDDPGVILDCEI